MSKHVVTVPLSLDEIKTAQQEIDKFVQDVEKKIKDFLKALCDEGMTIYQAKITNAGTLQPIQPFNIEHKEEAHTAYFRVTDKVAVFIEFGTGLKGQGKPHPEASEVGWQYNIGDTIAEDGSWFYPTDESDPNPYKWYTKDGNIYAWTRCGIPSRPYIHETANELRQDIHNIAKEVFK